MAAMEKRRSERAKSVCMKEQMSVHKYSPTKNKIHKIAAARFKIFFFFMDSSFRAINSKIMVIAQLYVYEMNEKQVVMFSIISSVSHMSRKRM